MPDLSEELTKKISELLERVNHLEKLSSEKDEVIKEIIVRLEKIENRLHNLKSKIEVLR
jgi:phage shock protein A